MGGYGWLWVAMGGWFDLMVGKENVALKNLTFVLIYLKIWQKIVPKFSKKDTLKVTRRMEKLITLFLTNELTGHKQY